MRPEYGGKTLDCSQLTFKLLADVICSVLILLGLESLFGLCLGLEELITLHILGFLQNTWQLSCHCFLKEPCESSDLAALDTSMVAVASLKEKKVASLQD